MDPTLAPPFDALANAVDEMVYVWRANGEMLWVNPVFERQTGMRLEDFGFRTEENPFVHPDDLPQALAVLVPFMQSDEPISPPFENRFYDVWGQVRSIRSTASRVVFQGESVFMTVSRITDGATLPQSADTRYRGLVEAAEDGIVDITGKGRINWSNRRFHEMTSSRAAELVQHDFATLFAEDARDLVRAALDEVEERGETRSVRACLADQDLWLDVKISRQPDGHRLVIARDVTATIRLQQDALRREKESALGLLMGTVSHDLNNIFTAVLANVSFIDGRLDAEQDVGDAVRDIQRAARRAARMGRSMLSYLGETAGDIHRIDLDETVRQTSRMVQPLLGATVRVDLSGLRAGAVIDGASARLGQVFMNLLTNAAQSMGQAGGHIRVETDLIELSEPPSDLRPGTVPAGAYARLRVTDDGSGMPQDVVDRIFEPYFSTKREGHGLGLATSLDTVREHGGGLRVLSVPGEGTTFEVYLPTVDGEASVAVQAPVATERPPAGIRIVVIDDDPVICSVVARIMRRQDADVRTATDGEEGLRLLDDYAADVLILDSKMPGISGAEIASRVRTAHPSLPILVSSGFQDVDIPGAMGFLPKPYSSVDLTRAVAALLSDRPS